MDPAIAEILGPVTAILGLGTMILIGVKLRYSHKEKMRLGEGGSGVTEHLGEDVAVLRDEVRLLREGFAELYERVEFAERLLTKGRTDGSS